MPSPETIRETLVSDIPDAEVSIEDTKGSGDHFRVDVRSSAFNGLSRIEQHRKIYASLQSMLDDGSIHALSIKTRGDE